MKRSFHVPEESHRCVLTCVHDSSVRFKKISRESSNLRRCRTAIATLSPYLTWPVLETALDQFLFVSRIDSFQRLCKIGARTRSINSIAGSLTSCEDR